MTEIKIASKFKKYFLLRELKMWIISIFIGTLISLIIFGLIHNNYWINLFVQLGYSIAESLAKLVQ